MEISEEYDKTSGVLATLITHAQSVPYFDCQKCIACIYPKWEERKPEILARAEVLKDQVLKRHTDEWVKFQERVKLLTKGIQKDDEARTLSKEEYDKISDSLEQFFLEA